MTSRTIIVRNYQGWWWTNTCRKCHTGRLGFITYLEAITNGLDHLTNHCASRTTHHDQPGRCTE